MPAEGTPHWLCTVHTGIANCTACRRPKSGHQVDDYAKQTSDLAWPILANLGFSGVCGIAAALALKVRPSGACCIAAAKRSSWVRSTAAVSRFKVRSAGEPPSCCVRG